MSLRRKGGGPHGPDRRALRRLTTFPGPAERPAASSCEALCVHFVKVRITAEHGEFIIADCCDGYRLLTCAVKGNCRLARSFFGVKKTNCAVTEKNSHGIVILPEDTLYIGACIAFGVEFKLYILT